MKRSPWFNARTQPPVNGGEDAMYEHRCRGPRHEYWREVRQTRVRWIRYWACDRCQWRGLLLESDDATDAP